MSTLTGRYVSSPESQFSRDLRMIEEKGFTRLLEEVEASRLSDSFWETTLVSDLESSSVTNPAYIVYLASQLYDGDASLLAEGTKVDFLIDNVTGDRHHVFPKEYLRKNGYANNQRNQVANYAYIGKKDNITISDKSPKEYFGIVLDQCRSKSPVIGDITSEEGLRANMRVNCIPEMTIGAEAPDYEEFLDLRRALMAEKIHAYYLKLKSRCRSDLAQSAIS